MSGLDRRIARAGAAAGPSLLRLPGWLAQWEEMLSDPEQKIARPRQIYTGYDERDFVPLANR